jgi:GNAT superfamily N-acetyltransferase
VGIVVALGLGMLSLAIFRSRGPSDGAFPDPTPPWESPRGRDVYGQHVHDLVYRDATEADLPLIVRMYADDALGSSREDPSDPLPASYLEAFRKIDADERHHLVVLEHDGEVVGTLQLSFLPHLVLRGGERAQIEAVRVRSDRRGSGLGEAMVTWAVEQARQRGCLLVQLTTNAGREDAHRFYERLGFAASHIGMKLSLTEP